MDLIYKRCVLCGCVTDVRNDTPVKKEIRMYLKLDKPASLVIRKYAAIRNGTISNMFTEYIRRSGTRIAYDQKGVPHMTVASSQYKYFAVQALHGELRFYFPRTGFAVTRAEMKAA